MLNLVDHDQEYANGSSANSFTCFWAMSSCFLPPTHAPHGYKFWKRFVYMVRFLRDKCGIGFQNVSKVFIFKLSLLMLTKVLGLLFVYTYIDDYSFIYVEIKQLNRID